MQYYSYTQGNGPFYVWGEGAGVTRARAEGRRFYLETTMTEPEGCHTVYSDRLLQWDWDKHNELCMKHFGNKGQNWHNRDPKLIQAFLSDYIGHPVELVTIWQYNNASSGHPVWLFWYREVK